MYGKSDVSDQLEAYLKTIEPTLSYGQALTKRWSDARVQEFLRAHEEAPPEEVEPVPVTKADDGDTPAWRAIRKAAGRLVADAEGAITFAEAVEQTVTARPELYTQYCRELAGME
jgi:hypothetical protein